MAGDGAPEGSLARFRRRVAAVVARRGVGGAVVSGAARLHLWVAHGLRDPRGLFRLEHRPEDWAVVTLYTDRDDLFPHYRPRRGLRTVRTPRVRVSLIATMFNERAGLAAWVASVAAQTRRPEELIVVDAGSTDGSRDELEAQAARHALALTVLVAPGASIARGRNLAIANATGAVVAGTDLGCRLTPAWLERIIAPFEDDGCLQVAAGWYVALEGGQPRRRLRWPTLDEVDPARFVPTSRSIAFTRDAWVAVGGYPEWLTLTGEDTWFALELRRFCERWAFVPEAVVEWDAPATMREYWGKIHAWSAGDGESSVAARQYWWTLSRLAMTMAGVAGAAVGAGAAAVLPRTVGRPLAVGAAALAVVAAAPWRRAWALGGTRGLAWEIGADVARVTGFLGGARRRPRAMARRLRGARGLAFILSGVPIDDTGGGARCTQIARELLKRGWFVVFVNRFPRHESRDLGLRIRHARLTCVPLETFGWRRFIEDHRLIFRDRGVAAIVEFPLADFIPVIRAIRGAGGTVIYDLLDRWEGALGGAWYSAAGEREIAALAHILVATAPSLREHLTVASGRPVTLLPNAVDTDLFDPDRSWSRPRDLPGAAWSALYIGALWGDWFDWDLLRQLALACPEAAIVVIGDYRGQFPAPPTNLRFLGLKPQAELPAYLAHCDVAIIPWKINALTHATSPLKAYEYLAMRRPVVAPRLDALAGFPGTWLADDADQFIRLVREHRSLGEHTAAVEKFVHDNSWRVRVDTLLGLLSGMRAGAGHNNCPRAAGSREGPPGRDGR